MEFGMIRKTKNNTYKFYRYHLLNFVNISYQSFAMNHLIQAW